MYVRLERYRYRCKIIADSAVIRSTIILLRACDGKNIFLAISTRVKSMSLKRVNNLLLIICIYRDSSPSFINHERYFRSTFYLTRSKVIPYRGINRVAPTIWSPFNRTITHTPLCERIREWFRGVITKSSSIICCKRLVFIFFSIFLFHVSIYL